MKRDNTPWRPVLPAAIDWSEHDAPRSASHGDVYYSRDNGLAESRHVFLHGNGLPQRWHSGNDQRSFCIAETGFGTGLNFLMTWQAWRQLPAPRPRLHYVSFERHPLQLDDLRRALSGWPELEQLSGELLAVYPGLLPGQHRLHLDAGSVTLDLWWEDVTYALPELASREQACVDAWYLDGFAPARNQSMWSPEIFASLAAMTKPGGSFATFTAAGQVRRDLATAGFVVDKIPGYGRKRESLRGVLEQPVPAPSQSSTPWDLGAPIEPEPAAVIVIGAGLAGCTVAAALARRGLAVTLLEQGGLASGGSGNEQGILYTRLSRKHSALTDFALQSFAYATRFYRDAFATGELSDGLDGSLCGSFHVGVGERDLDYLDPVLQEMPGLARVMEAEEASELLGVDLSERGIWYPDSGWLRPASVCQFLARQPGISLMEHCGSISLAYEDGGWQARSGDNLLARGSCAVLATGTGWGAMQQTQWLPLQAIRGQTTQLPAGSLTAPLRAAFCHDGYIAPARDGFHCIGATFDLGDPVESVRPEDHRSNLDALACALPDWRQGLQSIAEEQLTGRVGFRCASPDYLPLVGPLPDRRAFLEIFAGLRKNARQRIPSKGCYLPGLYLSSGHGSRGLTSTPLAAELIASQITGESPPLSRELCRALSPARFLVRDLARNRI